MLWYECGGYDRISQNSFTITIRAKNFRDTVSWLAIIKAISYCNLPLVRHTWELKLTFLKFSSFMPERSLKCEGIRMTSLLILFCSKDFFFSFHGEFLFKSALSEVHLLYMYIWVQISQLLTIQWTKFVRKLEFDFDFFLQFYSHLQLL